jgi:hypothetical protein
MYQRDKSIENTRNRKDRTVLTIRSKKPEKLLAPDVAHPKEVKHLSLTLATNNTEYECFCDIVNTDKEDEFEKCDCVNWWYTEEDLCKDLVHFTNLESLKLYDVNLDNSIYIELAKNSTCLKELRFEETYSGGYGGFLNLNGDENLTDMTTSSKKTGLEAMFKISTLRKVSFSYCTLNYFPIGPSNIEELTMRAVMTNMDKTDLMTKEDLKKIYIDFGKNLITHQNLKTIKMEVQYSKKPYKFEHLKLENLEKLSHLTYENAREDFDDKDYDVFTTLFKKTNLKSVWLNYMHR